MTATKPDQRKKRNDGVRTIGDIKGRCVIDGESGCWLWRGAMGRSSCRKIRPTTRVWLPADLSIDGAGRVTTAAKAAWLLAGKPLQDGGVVWRHSCTRTDCISPTHGRAGTRQEMHQALAASDRLKGDPMRAAVNTRNRQSMLTPPDVVRQAEAMFDAGRLQKDIRAELGIQRTTAHLIRNGLHPYSANRQYAVRGASVFSWAGGA